MCLKVVGSALFVSFPFNTSYIYMDYLDLLIALIYSLLSLA